MGNVRDKRVLDLFSGSGAIGIEALSRGAKKCYFCDIDKESVKLTKQNLKLTGLEDAGIVVNEDALSFIKTLYLKKEVFDYIFLDPPYDAENIIRKIFKHLGSFDIVDENGVLVIETDKETQFLDKEYSFIKLKERTYSKTRVSFFIKEKGF